MIVLTSGSTFRGQFLAWDSDMQNLQPGLTVGGGDFTVNLYKDGVASGVSVTVTEIGSTGKYVVSFTPDTKGYWYLDLTITSTGRVLEFDCEARVAIDSVFEGVVDDDVSNSTSVFVDVGNLQTDNDFYKDMVVVVRRAGVLHYVGQVSGYSGGSKSFTVTPAAVTSAFAENDEYAVLPQMIGQFAGQVFY